MSNMMIIPGGLSGQNRKQFRSRSAKRNANRRRQAQNRVVAVALAGRSNGRRRRRGRGRKRGGRSRPGKVRNVYLQSLMEPETHVAKIPDVSGFPSVTFQQVMDGTLTSSATGDAALCVYPGCVTPTGSGTNGPLFNVVQGTGTTANVWLTGVSVPAPKSSTVLQNFALVRPVSGVLELEFVGSTGTDQGQIVGGPLMRGEACQQSFANAVQNEYSVAAPLRNGLRILWKPQDLIDLQYEPVLAAAMTGISYTTGASTPPLPSGSSLPEEGTDQPKAALFAIILGAAASTAVVRYRWIVNFEGVPETSALGLFEVTPKECNTSMIDGAMNFVSQLPWGTVWQKAGGLIDALARETLSSQLPTILGSVGAYGMRAGRNRVVQQRLTYDYPID